MGEKSRILIVGATGYIGKYVAKASAALGHPTFLLLRSNAPSDPIKAALVDSFKSEGITILHGSMEDYESLVAAVKQVDIVISCVGVAQIIDQLKLIDAIKEVGTIKRFLPSEFGIDLERAQPVEPAKGLFGLKIQIRRAVEAAGIPYTYVASNGLAGSFLANLLQPGSTAPPRDKVLIYGDGNTKAALIEEEDVGAYTVKAADDPRTLNKTLFLSPTPNIKSQNELVALWEQKIGKTLDKVIVPEDQLLKQIEESPFPNNLFMSIVHLIFVRGDQCNFEIGENGVEGSQLYPEVKYTTVDQYLNKFV